MTRLEKIKLIADTYGYGPQSRQLIEEMAECTVAINKMWRNRKDKDQKEKWRKNLISELADVDVVRQQLIYLLDCEDEVEKEIDYKTDRQLDRIADKVYRVIGEKLRESDQHPTDCCECRQHITNGGTCKNKSPKSCALFATMEKEDLK